MLRANFKTELDAIHCTFSGLEKYLELDEPLDKEQAASCTIEWGVSVEAKEDGIHAINVNVDQVKASFDYDYTDKEDTVSSSVDLLYNTSNQKTWSIDIEGLEFSADGSIFIRRVYFDFTDRIISIS